MLRSSVEHFKGNWDDHLRLIEFTFNKSFNSNSKMAPFQILYRQRYKSQIC